MGINLTCKTVHIRGPYGALFADTDVNAKPAFTVHLYALRIAPSIEADHLIKNRSAGRPECETTNNTRSGEEGEVYGMNTKQIDRGEQCTQENRGSPNEHFNERNRIEF